MDFLSLTQSNWFLVGPVAKVLGVVMNGIYEFLDMFGHCKHWIGDHFIHDYY